MRYLLFIFVFISSTTLAQNGINYQGAATDSDGAKLADQNISLRTSVLQGGVDGTTSYSETHNTTTDQFGLFNVVIGQGEVVSGVFDSISWGADAHFLKVELDATGGSDFSLVSTTQMMSVPYAKYAENVKNEKSHYFSKEDLTNIISQGEIYFFNHFMSPYETYSHVFDKKILLNDQVGSCQVIKVYRENSLIIEDFEQENSLHVGFIFLPGDSIVYYINPTALDCTTNGSQFFSFIGTDLSNYDKIEPILIRFENSNSFTVPDGYRLIPIGLEYSGGSFTTYISFDSNMSTSQTLMYNNRLRDFNFLDPGTVITIELDQDFNFEYLLYGILTKI